MPCGLVPGLRRPFGISPLPQFDQLAGAFRSFQDVKILGIGEVELLWRVDPGFQSGVIDAAFALRVRIPFKDVLLKLLKEPRIIPIIPEKRLPLVHEILPGLLKYLCRSLLRGTQNSQFFSMRSRYLSHSFRIALAVVAVLTATSFQESELPYRIIIASRTRGGASTRMRSASIAASVAEICE
jgi:hypothetical protein